MTVAPTWEPGIIFWLKTPRHCHLARTRASRSSNTTLSSEQTSLLISAFYAGVHDMIAGVCRVEFQIWVNCRFKSCTRRQRCHFFSLQASSVRWLADTIMARMHSVSVSHHSSSTRRQSYVPFKSNDAESANQWKWCWTTFYCDDVLSGPQKHCIYILGWKLLFRDNWGWINVCLF